MHSDFRLLCVLKVQFYFFHMWYGIRILSLFHINTQTISIINLNCPKNANCCLRRHTIVSDHVSHSFTVIVILFQVKHKQLSAKPYRSIPIHSKEHRTKCDFHGAVLNNTDCVWTVNAMTGQLSFTSDGWDRSFVLSTHKFYAFWGQFKFRREMSQWNRLKILILKHMLKSKIWLLEQK